MTGRSTSAQTSRLFASSFPHARAWQRNLLIGQPALPRPASGLPVRGRSAVRTAASMGRVLSG